MSNASSPPQTQLRAGIGSHAFLLALATFAIGTDAFIIAGILPQISHDLTVTISSAGLVVSVFSISYAVGAPIVSALFGLGVQWMSKVPFSNWDLSSVWCSGPLPGRSDRPYSRASAAAPIR